MIEILKYSDDFREFYKYEQRPVIVYGAGFGLENCYADLPHIDMICDKNAESIKTFHGEAVYMPEQISAYTEPVYIIVCIINENVFYEVCQELEKICVDARIIHAFNNIAFGNSFWRTPKEYRATKVNEKLRINIVCLEEAWIFRKFAERMCENLKNENVEVEISSDTRDDVDINHHIPYVAYKPYPNDTLMITHVDNMRKIMLLKKQLETAGMGICMSKDTLNKLAAYGVPRNKLCYINPAQDNVIKPRKYVIGITHKCHDEQDVRKRATAVLDVIDGVCPDYFRFIIMGAGWNDIITEIQNKGFEVSYYPEFIYDLYTELMQQIDYFLYMGFDEGTMGYLDALAAGAGTIVTPQGYHLDVDCPIDYPCSTVKQFREAFLDLQAKKEKKIRSVEEWTWKNYTLKHMEVWNYLLHRTELKELYKKQLFYEDGIYSVMMEDNRV